MSNIVEKYSRALKMYRDDGISVPVLPSEMRALIADFLAIKEHCAALESREVCTVAHEDVETCGYCQRDALSKDAERYRWLRDRYVAADFAYGDPPSVAMVFEMPGEMRFSPDLDFTIDAEMTPDSATHRENDSHD